MQALCWVSGGRKECRLCVGSVGVEGNAGSVGVEGNAGSVGVEGNAGSVLGQWG